MLSQKKENKKSISESKKPSETAKAAKLEPSIFFKLKERYNSSKGFRIAVTVIRWGLFVAGLFLVLMPVLPYLVFYFRQLTGQFDYPSQSAQFEISSGTGINASGKLDQIPEDNRLLIPVIGVNVNIVEGDTEEALEYGAWRRPATSTPDQGGNTVITGHRFKYLPPNNLTFYNLDKVQIGDAIIVYWNKIEYDYVVTEVFVVEPSQVEVEDNTTEPRITLYTCTPLWTADKRLVIVAEPYVADTATEQTESAE